MRFPGYWVEEDQGKVVIKATEFDDTELSDHSDWKEAWQNDDPSLPHGFVDPLTMMQHVCRRIDGEVLKEQVGKLVAGLNSEVGFEVKTLSDLTMLIPAILPDSCLPHTTGNGSEIAEDDPGDEIPSE